MEANSVDHKVECKPLGKCQGFIIVFEFKKVVFCEKSHADTGEKNEAKICNEDNFH